MDNKDDAVRPSLSVEYPEANAPETAHLQVAAVDGVRTDAPITKVRKRMQTSEDFLKDLLGEREPKPLAIKTARGYKEIGRVANDAEKKTPRGI